MKKMNRILALTLTLCLLLCLCACGGANEQSFSERMALAQKNMAALHSVRMETTMDVSMEMSATGQTQSMDMTVAYVVESNQDSGICRMEMTTTAMGTSQKLLAYSETVDGATTVYVSMDGGHSWQKQNGNTVQMPSNPEQVTELFLNNANSFQPAGTETINGSRATVYTGVLDEKYLEEVMQMTGLGSSLDSALGMEGGEEMFRGLGDVPMTIAIDDASGQIVRYTMDVTKVMQTLMENLLSAAMQANGMGGIEFQITIHKAEGVTVFSQFDAVGEITIPEEARTA